MFWSIAIALALLWVLGVLTSTTLGGFIHVLILAAVVLMGVAFFRGRKHEGSGPVHG